MHDPQMTLVRMQAGLPARVARGKRAELCMDLLQLGYAKDAEYLAKLKDDIEVSKPKMLNEPTVTARPECGCSDPVTGWFLMEVDRPVSILSNARKALESQ